ncbi:MAG: flippase, partial [Bacteroidales bacterium]|nr:flippase [Bacteroidales bacterium]
LISLILIFFVSTFSNNDAKTTMYVVILGAGTIFQSFETIDFFFQSKVLAKYVSACKLIQLSISSIVKVFLVVSKKDLFWFVLANFLDQVTLAISLYFAYRTRGNKAFFKKFELMTAKNLLADSWPLILSSLMVIIYMRIDQIMIKQMLNSEAVGQYAAAVKVSEIWNFVPVLIVNSLFPAIISAKKISESLYYQRLQQLYTLLFWISVCFALPITLLSKSLINILFGHKYMEAASILVIHVWTGVFISFSAASARWYILEGLSVVQFYRQLFGAIICIFLNFLLIPPMGTIGAAVSTLISYFCASYLFDLFSKNTRICLLQKTYSILFKGLLKQAR